jgi:hypothetical protein
MELKHYKVVRKVNTCPYNEACGCEKKTCSTCGWNPKVSDKRMAKVRQQRQEVLARG